MGSIQDLISGGLDTSSELAGTALESVGELGLDAFGSLNDLVDTDN